MSSFTDSSTAQPLAPQPTPIPVGSPAGRYPDQRDQGIEHLNAYLADTHEHCAITRSLLHQDGQIDHAKDTITVTLDRPDSLVRCKRLINQRA